MHATVNNNWGTVCDNGWDERDATIVCNQLIVNCCMTVQSAAVFGAVGGALAVVMVAIVLIVVVTAVMIVTKRRKSNHQDAAGKGTCIVDVIYIGIQVIHSDNNSNVYLGKYTTWSIDITFKI